VHGVAGGSGCCFNHAVYESGVAAAAYEKPPAAIQVFVILLYVGGGLTVLSALTRMLTGVEFSPVHVVTFAVGLGYLVLAHQVRRGRRWARIVALALCGVGVVKAAMMLTFGGGGVEVVSVLAWPVVYAILLNTKDARAWCRR
jgi:hypothetical protein